MKLIGYDDSVSKQHRDNIREWQETYYTPYKSLYEKECNLSEFEMQQLLNGLMKKPKVVDWGKVTGIDAYHVQSVDETGTCYRGSTLARNQRALKTIKDAGIEPKDITYINAHGTSTPYNDKFETAAIHKVFGEHAKKLMVSSTKGMTGHLLGAAGAIEAAVCAKTIETGIIAPTVNYENPDPDCDLDYVPNIAREVKVDTVISTNLGFGGHNGALLFKRLK